MVCVAICAVTSYAQDTRAKCPKPRIITDLSVRDAALSNARSDDEGDTAYTLMEHAGLIVLRLGFAPAKNAETAHYLAEAIHRRGNKPLWITEEDCLLPAQAANGPLRRALDDIPVLSLTGEPPRTEADEMHELVEGEGL